MSKQQDTSGANSLVWLANIRQAIRTLNLSVVIALISLTISLFTLFWAIRPARISPTISVVFASAEGGMHMSVPLSIVNTGARSAAVLAAKLVESEGGRDALWGADFTVEPARAIPAITGAVTPTNATLWVPFQVPGNGQVERVFIFRPIDDRSPNVIQSGRKVGYRVVLLLSGNVEATASTTVTWPSETNAILARKKGGVGSFGADLERWVLEPSHD